LSIERSCDETGWRQYIEFMEVLFISSIEVLVAFFQRCELPNVMSRVIIRIGVKVMEHDLYLRVAVRVVEVHDDVSDIHQRVESADEKKEEFV